MTKIKTFFFILFYALIFTIAYFFGFDFKEVLAVELWSYNFPMTFTDIRFSNGLNGAESQLTDNVNSSLTIGAGSTGAISYAPYFHAYVQPFTPNHNYTLEVPICTNTNGQTITGVGSFSIKHSTSTRTIGAIDAVGLDPCPYSANGTSVYCFQHCALIYVNFDYTGDVYSSNSTNYVSFNINRGASKSSNYFVFGYNLFDNGVSSTYTKSQADRVLSAIQAQSSDLSNINNNTSNINSNLNYDGSDSDLSNVNGSDLSNLQSNENALLSNSNVASFNFSNIDSDTSSGVLFVFQIMWSFCSPILPLIVVCLSIGLIALILNRK